MTASRAIAAAILAVLVGCTTEVVRKPGPTAAVPAALTAEAIGNASFRSGLLEGTPVTLREGRYERGDGVVAWLLTELTAHGEVAGRPTAAVLLAESGGGTGIFISLVLVQEADGRAASIASTLLGDRPRVRQIAIESDGTVLVDMLQVGEKDAFCCPSTPMIVRYALEDGKLVVRSLETGPR
jgi:hypothetical protein